MLCLLHTAFVTTAFPLNKPIMLDYTLTEIQLTIGSVYCPPQKIYIIQRSTNYLQLDYEIILHSSRVRLL